MATDPFFINYFKQRNLSGKCEIGMHLHAWNNPPEYDLPIRNDTEPGAPYLIEYPDEVMFKKVEFMTRTLENAFEQKPVTHRAGRWATNSLYFSALQNFGYKIDCSVTPGMDWSHAPGQKQDHTGVLQNGQEEQDRSSEPFGARIQRRRDRAVYSSGPGTLCGPLPGLPSGCVETEILRD